MEVMKMVRSLWCPKCKKKGLNPYDKKGVRPDKVDDIDHVWCLYCGYRIESKISKGVK